MFYLCVYFLGIYLIIAEYIFLPKEKNRYAIMLGIHLCLGVPSSFFIIKESISTTYGIHNNFYLVLLGTVILSTISLTLSGVLVNKLK